jgi:hypothetical protein
VAVIALAAAERTATNDGDYFHSQMRSCYRER